MIKAVFFDLYDTLVHYQPPREELQVAACKEFGIEVALEAVRRATPVADSYFYRENARSSVFKRSPEDKMAVYAEYESTILREAGVDVSGEVALQILEKFRQFDKKLVLYDDAVPTFQMLRSRGLILGLISNVERDAVPFDELGLTSHLDFLITSEKVGVGKPHPKIFLAALEQARIQAGEAIHIGDQYEMDIVGARGVGIKPLLLDRNDRWQKISDCPRIRSLTEVVDYL